MAIFFLSIFTLLPFYVTCKMDLILLKNYPEAQCLDGSPAGMYWQAGQGTGSNNFMILFEGGGMCGGINESAVYKDCLNRAQSRLGSSRFWTKTFIGPGILSDDPLVNPNFYNWNKVLVNYCTGLLHGGYKKDPVQVSPFQYLYFKGNNVTDQTFRFLIKEKGLLLAGKVILTGISAGGCAVYSWANHFKSLLPNTVKVFAVPDSGYFTHFVDDGVSSNATTLATYDNTNDIYPLQCPFRGDPKNAYKCFYQEYIADYVKIPMLVINSQYDLYDLGLLSGMPCVLVGSLQYCNFTDKERALAFRNNFQIQIRALIQDQPNRGVWAPACVIHGITAFQPWNNPNWEVPQGSGNTVDVVLYRFISEQADPNNYYYWDNQVWPDNTGCSKNTASSDNNKFDDSVSFFGQSFEKPQEKIIIN